MTDYKVKNYSEWFLNKNGLTPIVSYKYSKFDNLCCVFFNNIIMDELYQKGVIQKENKYSFEYYYKDDRIFDIFPVIKDTLNEKGFPSIIKDDIDDAMIGPGRNALRSYMCHIPETTLFLKYSEQYIAEFVDGHITQDQANEMFKKSYQDFYICDTFDDVINVCLSQTYNIGKIDARKAFLGDVYKKLNQYLDTYCVFKNDKADTIRKEYYRSDLYILPFRYIIDDEFIKKYADLAENTLKMTIDRNKLVIK